MNKFQANQAAATQAETFTPSVPAVGNTFTIGLGNKSVTFTATATTVANVTAGLVAAVQALQAAGPSEWSDVAAADNTTNVGLSAVTPGQPFTTTASAAAGTGGGAPTLTKATVTANRSPNDAADAANWSAGHTPAAAEDVVFDNTSGGDCLWNLDFNTVTANSVTVTAGYTGKIGLPARNPAGYAEYRGQYFKIGATTVNVGEGIGTGPSRFNLDTGSAQTALNLFATGAGADGDVPPVQWKGTHASNVFNRAGGSAGVALGAGEVATLALNCAASDAAQGGTAVRLGSGVTFGAAHVSGGEVVTSSGPASANVEQGGTLTLLDAAGVAGACVVKGRLNWTSTGTLAALTVHPTGVVDRGGELRAAALTACTVYRGGTLNNPNKSITTPPAIAVPDGGLESITLVMGTNITVTVA